MTMYYMGEQSIKNMEGVEFALKQVAYRALTILSSAKGGVDFGIPSTGGLREDEAQHQLFLDEKSAADGYTIRGKHQANKNGKSEAIDFYAYVEGKANYEPHNLAIIAVAFLQAASELETKIKWGGLFRSSIDMPHIELV